jgi:hypothetical protein
MMQYGYDPLSNPPEDFEMNPHDFDLDAELIPTDMNVSSGFVLQSRDGQGVSMGACVCVGGGGRIRCYGG